MRTFHCSGLLIKFAVLCTGLVSACLKPAGRAIDQDAQTSVNSESETKGIGDEGFIAAEFYPGPGGSEFVCYLVGTRQKSWLVTLSRLQGLDAFQVPSQSPLDWVRSLGGVKTSGRGFQDHPVHARLFADFLQNWSKRSLTRDAVKAEMIRLYHSSQFLAWRFAGLMPGAVQTAGKVLQFAQQTQNTAVTAAGATIAAGAIGLAMVLATSTDFRVRAARKLLEEQGDDWGGMNPAQRAFVQRLLRVSEHVAEPEQPSRVPEGSGDAGNSARSFINWLQLALIEFRRLAPDTESTVAVDTDRSCPDGPQEVDLSDDEAYWEKRRP